MVSRVLLKVICPCLYDDASDSFQPYSPGLSMSPRPRKRRFSDASPVDIRKRLRTLPGQSRNQTVSDPLPHRSVTQADDFDAVWMDLFSPMPSSVLVNDDKPRPMTLVSPELPPLVTEEDVVTLCKYCPLSFMKSALTINFSLLCSQSYS